MEECPPLGALREKCAELHGISGELHGDLSTSERRCGEMTRGQLILLDLKGINRAVHQDIEGCKRATDEERKQFDANSLQLHNLLYQKHHYQRQISRCQDFRSKHHGIDLVPEDEFSAAAPSEIQRAAADDAHQVCVCVCVVWCVVWCVWGVHLSGCMHTCRGERERGWLHNPFARARRRAGEQPPSLRHIRFRRRPPDELGCCS